MTKCVYLNRLACVVYMTKRGITPTELAKKAGLSRAYVNQAVRGRIAISPRAIRSLADVLEVEPNRLLVEPVIQ